MFYKFNWFDGFNGFNGDGAAHFVILSGEKRRMLKAENGEWPKMRSPLEKGAAKGWDRLPQRGRIRQNGQRVI